MASWVGVLPALTGMPNVPGSCAGSSASNSEAAFNSSCRELQCLQSDVLIPMCCEREEPCLDGQTELKLPICFRVSLQDLGDVGCVHTESKTLKQLQKTMCWSVAGGPFGTSLKKSPLLNCHEQSYACLLSCLFRLHSQAATSTFVTICCSDVRI